LALDRTINSEMTMHRVPCGLAVLLAFVLTAAASTSSVAPLAAQSTPEGFKTEIERQFSASAMKVIMLAEAMPAEKYGWSPGEGVASTSSVYLHIARYNYMYLEESMGIASPIAEDAYMGWEADVTERFQAKTASAADKEWIVGVLTASVEHVQDNLEHLSDADLTAPTHQYGRDVQKWAVMLQLVAHMNEHLGQSIAYARMNGVVPPWSS
jgi:uncharacterized damage-inducible protein DinB